MIIVDRLPHGVAVILATDEAGEAARIVDGADTATRVRMLERLREIAAEPENNPTRSRSKAA